MANVPIKTLKDNKGNAFVPFTTTTAVFEDGTGKTVAQLLGEQNTKIGQIESAIPTKTSDLTNDSGFITSADVPTKTSDLTNDSGFITNSDIPTNVSAFTNDAGYITSADVPTNTSDLTNDSGFIDNSVNNLINYTKTTDLATVAISGDYDDLTNKPTIPTVNNATLTIQKNATTIDTFTANASSDVLVNIEVPTKTSDLTNDSDFITKDVNDLTNYTTTTDLTTALNNKVDKVNGKGLSTEDYTTAEQTKLSGIEAGAEVNTIETIKVNGTAVTPDANKAVDITIPAASEYTIEEVSATTGYAKTYQLKKDSTFIGAKIDIPKDLVVSSGEVKTVTTPDVPYIGAQVGDKYIDLTLNDSTASHIYIPVNDLVDAYTSGNGIEISNANVISAKLDTSNTNGLSVSASGIALAAATTSAAGAMSAADKTKLDTIESNADANTIESISVNSTPQTIDVNKNVDITVPTKTSDLTNDSNFVADANYIHTDNNYTNNEKTKLSGIETGAQVNTIETVKVNGIALTPDANKAVDITVSPSQYDTMPTPAAAIEGKIVQYVGDTTTVAPIYTNGLFYKCVEDSETPGTYIWENISVIDDYVIAEDIQGQTSISGITILPADNSVTYNMFTSDVKGRFVETFSGTTNPSSSLGKDGDVYFLID